MSSRKNTIFLITIVLLSLPLGFMAARWWKGERTDQEKNGNRSPIQIISNASTERIELPDLSKRAEQIIIGTVVTIYPSRWSTADGQLPSNTTADMIQPGTVILTDVDVKVDRVLKGPSRDSVRVRTFGGEVGQDTMIASWSPQFQNGQQYVLFLVKDDGSTANIGPDHYAILGAIQGSYAIQGKRAISGVGEMVLTDLIATVESNRP